MAYVSQDRKKGLEPRVKEILKKHGLKGSLSVRHHSTLVLTVQSGKIDFYGDVVNKEHANPDHIDVNVYWYKEHFTGAALKFLKEVMPVLNDGNWDKSDIQTDYFNVGWYVDVNIGRWNKPYRLEVGS